jgi:S1-C subfamily serine protease
VQVASSFGLRPGDLVVAVDGVRVTDMGAGAVNALLEEHDPSTPARVTGLRDGATVTVDVPLAPRR